MQKIILSVSLLIFSCNNSIESEDCAGVAGGNSIEDDCGVCDSNLSNDCMDCITYFDFFQSSQQAFYHFNNVTINDINISAEDTVAAFKGDICVGTLSWDTSVCGGGVCAVPVMGYDSFLSEETAGYMQSGDIPTFKIYDVSDSLIYNAIPDSIVPWINMGVPLFSTLEADITSAAPCKLE